MGSSDKFCLRWNDFESNLSSAFRDLRRENALVDVTLACEGGDRTVGAHRVILSACSPFFERVLKRQCASAEAAASHPFLYFKGVRHKDLVAVLDFMYHGQVNVAQDELDLFLAAAEELSVKGLTNGSKAGDSAGSDNGTASTSSSSKDERTSKAQKRDAPSPSTSQLSSAAKKVKAAAAAAAAATVGDEEESNEGGQQEREAAEEVEGLEDPLRRHRSQEEEDAFNESAFEGYDGYDEGMMGYEDAGGGGDNGAGGMAHFAAGLDRRKGKRIFRTSYI